MTNSVRHGPGAPIYLRLAEDDGVIAGEVEDQGNAVVEIREQDVGTVVGGLVGRRKFIYDLWGDTVKLARRIESDGRTSIRVTRPVYERVRELVGFGPPTTVDVRGIGTVELFSIVDEATL